MRNCKKDGRLENVYINLTKEETNKLSEILKKKSTTEDIRWIIKLLNC